MQMGPRGHGSRHTPVWGNVEAPMRTRSVDDDNMPEASGPHDDDGEHPQA